MNRHILIHYFFGGAICLVVLFLPFVILPSLAAQVMSQNEINGVYVKFLKSQVENKTLTCMVTQTLQVRGLSHPVVSFGKLFFQQPDQILLRYESPPGGIMLLQGNQLFVRKREGMPLQKKSILPGGRDPLVALLGIFSILNGQLPKFGGRGTLSATRQGSLVILKIPEDKSVAQPCTELAIDAYSMRLKFVSIVLNGLITATFEFTDTEINIGIPDEVFRVDEITGDSLH